MIVSIKDISEFRHLLQKVKYYCTDLNSSVGISQVEKFLSIIFNNLSSQFLEIIFMPPIVCYLHLDIRESHTL